jgi:hypothetical protein
MHRSVITALGWQVEAWEESSGDAPASQDSQLVLPDPGGRRLRVAVLDGVTPTSDTPRVAGVDGAMYAAGVARLALQDLSRPLEDCVLAANAHLFAAGVAHSRDQAQTCVTAADIRPDGRVDVVRAGDCDAWARVAGGWVALGTGSALTPVVASEWDRWQRDHPAVTRAERHTAEEALLGRRSAWTSTAVGRFAQPTVRRYSVAGVTELVLASDGARLSPRVLDRLDGWLGRLRAWESHRGAIAGEKVHDDVTVLRITRRAASALARAA